MKVPGIPYVQGRNAYTDVDGRKYGIAIHNTANDATAEGEASYATRRNDGISAHFYVDNDSIIQSLDTVDKAGHAGSTEGNENAVAVEITGTNDKPRQWWLDNVAWDRLGYVLAAVCRFYGIQVRRASVYEMNTNPKVRAFYGHNDMRLAWGGTTHTDPGPNFPWDRLFQAVDEALIGGNDVELSDVVAEAATPDNQRRTVGQVYGDLWHGVHGRIQNMEAALAMLSTAVAGLVARPPVDLTDAQLELLADKVVTRLAPLIPTPAAVVDEEARRLAQ